MCAVLGRCKGKSVNGRVVADQKMDKSDRDGSAGADVGGVVRHGAEGSEAEGKYTLGLARVMSGVQSKRKTWQYLDEYQ